MVADQERNNVRIRVRQEREEEKLSDQGRFSRGEGLAKALARSSWEDPRVALCITALRPW